MSWEFKDEFVRVHGTGEFMPVYWHEGKSFISTTCRRVETELAEGDKVIGEYDPDRKVIHRIADGAEISAGITRRKPRGSQMESSTPAVAKVPRKRRTPKARKSLADVASEDGKIAKLDAFF